MKRIDEIKFREIHQVNPLELTNTDRDWVLHVMERDRVHRVEGVFTIELSREPIHHHNHLTRRRTALRRIDNESSVEAFVNMSLQGNSMTVIEVQAPWVNLEFIGEFATRLNNLENTIHPWRMDTVEMD